MPIFVGRYVPISSGGAGPNTQPKVPVKEGPATGSPIGLLLALTYTR